MPSYDSGSECGSGIGKKVQRMTPLQTNVMDSPSAIIDGVFVYGGARCCPAGKVR